MDLLNLSVPTDAAWELFAAVVVIVVGPVLFERFRLPGMIGLLVGGYLIGPNALGVVGSTTGLVADLGEFGLLYLMFMAGLELDLGVFTRHRTEAIAFCALTFLVPAALGTGAGIALDYSIPGAVLLGSLFASYTLVAYPVFRRAGLSANRAVAIAVGATVVTDTVALVILAVVSGVATGDASGLELTTQIVGGLGLLAGATFGLLPLVADRFFRTLGQSRTLRFSFVLAALLWGAVAAEIVGIEPIVGSFFAGLALNRLVPNEGEFMERIEFFGSALLVPFFLVSVGTVIQPAVMFDPDTLGLASIFLLACVGGKLLAALLTRPALHLSGPETLAIFSLSVAQAAATLAATFVGLGLGLFTTSTVNAVMIVVIVSLFVSSVTASRAVRALPPPPVDDTKLGRSVVVQLPDPEPATSVLAVAARLAASDGGVVRPVMVVPDTTDGVDPELLATHEAAVARCGLDSEIEVRHDRSVLDGMVHAQRAHRASLVVVPAATESWLPTLVGAPHHALVNSLDLPVAIVRAGRRAPHRVVLALATSQARRPLSATMLAARMAASMHRSGLDVLVVAGAPLAEGLSSSVGDPVVVVEQPIGWLGRELRDSDLLILPGGRNGSLVTARAVRQAESGGATVVVCADRQSVSAVGEAGRGLGLVAVGRRTAA